MSFSLSTLEKKNYNDFIPNNDSLNTLPYSLVFKEDFQTPSHLWFGDERFVQR